MWRWIFRSSGEAGGSLTGGLVGGCWLQCALVLVMSARALCGVIQEAGWDKLMCGSRRGEGGGDLFTVTAVS